MIIPNGKSGRNLSAAFFSPVLVAILASGMTASINEMAVAQEATAEVNSAQNANLDVSPSGTETVTETENNSQTESNSERATLLESREEAAQDATSESASDEATTQDDSKVVSADGSSASGSTTIALASLAMVNSHSLAMTAIHNNYRSQAGLATQAVDPNLSNVAQNWANHMASVGSMYHGGGEQIIAYSGGDLSYDAGFRMWLNSSPHRAWLFSRGDRCGFGYAIGRNGCAYFAGAFGSSQSAVSSGSNSYSGGYQSATNSGRRFRVFRRRG